MTARLKYQFGWAWAVTSGHRSALLRYFMLEVLGIVLSLLFVLWSKRAVDIAMHAGSSDLKVILGLVAGSVLLGLFVRSYAAWINERTRLKMGMELQRKIIDVQMISTWQVVKDWHSGDLQVRVHGDCNEVADMLATSAASFVLTLLKLLAAFGFLWSMDPMLALMVAAITPLFLFSKIYYKKMRALSRKIKQEESRYGETLQENLRFRVLIQAMDLLVPRRRMLEQQHNQINSLKSEQLNFSGITQAAVKVTMNIGYLLTFIWGVYRLHAGEISFGTMTAFLQLVGRIQSPMMSLIGFVPGFIRFRTALERLMELDAAVVEPYTEPVRIQNIRALHVEQVSFGYQDQQILQKLSICVKAAAPTAILGASGQGKTTLIRLMLGLLKPEAGELYLEDADLHRYNLTAAHRLNFAYVPQGNSLFSGTIRDNLLVAAPVTIDDAQMEHALWLACAEFVYALPQGLDTVVAEAGHGLSEGQAQRIAVARAMMRDADVWLFDEVTSALDQDTSNRLISRLLEAGREKLCIFVTHDSSAAAHCSQIIYLNS
jgi:ATP-binding cassette subfamily B protein